MSVIGVLELHRDRPVTVRQFYFLKHFRKGIRFKHREIPAFFSLLRSPSQKFTSRSDRSPRECRIFHIRIRASLVQFVINVATTFFHG